MQAVLAHFSGKYQQYTFVRTTVNNWKCKFQQKEPGEPKEKFERTSLFEDNILVKIKDAIIRLPLAVDLVLRKRTEHPARIWWRNYVDKCLS